MSLPMSLGLFIVAGLCEIGGGYLMWLAIREQRHWIYALVGAVVLICYGMIPTLQPAHFSRVYAAYGGMFIVLSLLWGWGIDGVRPDRYDVVGSMLCLAGMIVMMYVPRT